MVETKSWSGSSQRSSVLASGYASLSRAITSPIGAGERSECSVGAPTTIERDYSVVLQRSAMCILKTKTTINGTRAWDNRDICPSAYRTYFPYIVCRPKSILVSVGKRGTEGRRIRWSRRSSRQRFPEGAGREQRFLGCTCRGPESTGSS